MGDHADDAVNDCLAMDELYEEMRFAPITEQYEAGLCDEEGFSYYRSMFPPNHRHKGPGLCPKCGSKTIEKEGKFGRFYGCEKFPTCTGSRSI